LLKSAVSGTDHRIHTTETLYIVTLCAIGTLLLVCSMLAHAQRHILGKALHLIA